MTKLLKAVSREVSGVVREDLIVTIYPGGRIGVRAKRTRREYSLPLVTVYRLAIEAERQAKKHRTKLWRLK